MMYLRPQCQICGIRSGGESLNCDVQGSLMQINEVYRCGVCGNTRLSVILGDWRYWNERVMSLCSLSGQQAFCYPASFGKASKSFVLRSLPSPRLERTQYIVRILVLGWYAHTILPAFYLAIFAYPPKQQSKRLAATATPSQTHSNKKFATTTNQSNGKPQQSTNFAQ
jgi:hypothetical protein